MELDVPLSAHNILQHQLKAGLGLGGHKGGGGIQAGPAINSVPSTPSGGLDYLDLETTMRPRSLGPLSPRASPRGRISPTALVQHRIDQHTVYRSGRHTAGQVTSAERARSKRQDRFASQRGTDDSSIMAAPQRTKEELRAMLRFETLSKLDDLSMPMQEEAGSLRKPKSRLRRCTSEPDVRAASEDDPGEAAGGGGGFFAKSFNGSEGRSKSGESSSASSAGGVGNGMLNAMLQGQPARRNTDAGVFFNGSFQMAERTRASSFAEW